MNKSILYISYTGLLDPLGQSQVLQYVLGLANKHKMVLLTFEKSEALKDLGKVCEIREACEKAGVDWHYLIWHNKPGIPATVYDILQGTRKAYSLCKQNNVGVVHSRSYIGSMMALAIKKLKGARFIFDMRGFWPDERVDGGIWTSQSLPYRFFKRVEKSLFLGADHVVSLTRAGVDEFSKFGYLQGRIPPVSVIPTCTNLDIFRPVSNIRVGFTLGYVGSAGSWYMFEEVSACVKKIFDRKDDSRFLVINKGGHDYIKDTLIAAGVDMKRVEILEAPFHEVSEHVGRMDAGIFFIKPAWSKRASCPTRMGEFLACGKPCLANAGVGDVESDFKETRTGVTLDVDEQGNLVKAPFDQIIDQLFELAGEPDISDRCRKAAQERFSLESGIVEYDAIYKRLLAS